MSFKIAEFFGLRQKGVDGGFRGPAALRAFIEREIAPLFDFDYMGQWAAGALARRMTETQMAGFNARLRELFLEALVRNLGTFSRPLPRVDVYPARPGASASDAVVDARVSDGHGFDVSFEDENNPVGFISFPENDVTVKPGNRARGLDERVDVLWRQALQELNLRELLEKHELTLLFVETKVLNARRSLAQKPAPSVDQLIEKEVERAADDGANEERVEGGAWVAMVGAVWVSHSQHGRSDEFDGQCGDQRTGSKSL